MNGVPATPKRTPLFDEHVALGARMIPFGGFDMPVQYSGILKEHDAVRSRAGMFDLSHMGQFVLRGQVGEWADKLTINNVATMKPFQARYNIFCNEAGGAHDDVIFYRLPDHWLLVVNASNADKMWALLEAAKDGAIELENLHGSNALIALQGPLAVEIARELLDADPAQMKYYTCMSAEVAGVPALVARTGYTGEDGFEFFLDGDAAPRVWQRLLQFRARGLEPCGLGSRDVLRLEAGMPLYGHELTETITPLQAGMQWAVKFGKPDFVGKEALQGQQERDDYARIAGLVLRDRVPAREGYKVSRCGNAVGEVRSASIGPSVGNRQLATALLQKDAAIAGQTVEVEIRGTQHEARVVALPFYKRPQAA